MFWVVSWGGGRVGGVRPSGGWLGGYNEREGTNSKIVKTVTYQGDSEIYGWGFDTENNGGR